MPDSAIPLYTEKDLERLRFRRRFWQWALPILIALALGVIIFLIVTVDRFNEIRHELISICISTVTGWVAIYITTFTIQGGKRELQHAQTLADAPPEVISGTVSFSKDRFRIRGSIAIRKLEVDTGCGIRKTNVNAAKARRLKKAGPRLTLYVVHGYVAAYEPIR